MSLPIIDISTLRQNGRSVSPEVLTAIRQAYTEYGFFYITEHGIPEAIIHAAAQSALHFFQLPVEKKSKVSANAAHRGWHALGDARMYGAEKPDYKEFYQVGLELTNNDPDVQAGQPLRGPNNWPNFMPALREDMYAYFEAVGACGRDLLRGVAGSIGADPRFFEDKYEKPLQRTQAVYYPPQSDALGSGQFGVAPHTDFGNITLLWQDDTGGLELQSLSGEWLPAPPISGTIVVNSGDLLGRWSNDRYRSTMHRVVNRSGRERLSIATFYDPTFTAIIDPIDLNLSASEVCKYPPVSAGEHILRRIDASFGYRDKL